MQLNNMIRLRLLIMTSSVELAHELLPMLSTL